jgi:phosphoribosylaminoimidazole carboxylase
MDQKIGLLGGGQLGMMLCEAANPLNLSITILDAADSPAKQVNAKKSPHVTGSFTDRERIRELARQVDILTVEIEHVDTEVLEEIAEHGVEMEDGTRKKVPVQPSWRAIRVIQDKFAQKGHLAKAGVRTAESRAVDSTREALQEVGKQLGYPYMLKTRRDAYDGRGNFPVKGPGDIDEALEVLKGKGLYAERWANFVMELAVMVVKTDDGVTKDRSNTLAYPTVVRHFLPFISRSFRSCLRSSASRILKHFLRAHTNLSIGNGP